MRHELIERGAPAIVESHVGVFFAAVLVFVHHQRRVLGSLSLCLKRYDCRKDEPSTRGGIGLLAGRTEARLQRIGPGQLFVPDDFEICLLYTSDAADERSSVDLGGRRIIK